ncbi:MAG: hypothetical protein JXB32_15610 [Deltaproteobacteria bacterium]|nr:hypothetical protein [Deltaproteobacteria bacterium]
MTSGCVRHAVRLACAASLAATLAWPAAAGAAITIELFDRENRGAVDDEPVGINIADCEMNEAWNFRFSMSTVPSNAHLDVWLGSACDQLANRDGADASDCVQVYGDILMQVGYVRFMLEAPTLVNPTAPGCDEEVKTTTKIWVLIINEDADETIYDSGTYDVSIDTQRPAAPTEVTVEFGENRAIVNWKMAEGTQASEEWGFRVLCDPNPTVTAADADADADADPDAEAGADADDDTTEATDAGGDAGGGCSTTGTFAEGDEPLEDWYCTGQIVGTAVRTRQVDGLTNGTEYHFGVVALDDSRNPSLVSMVVCTVPEEVDDFWETYEAAGGQAEGGCACTAPGTGPAAGGVLALLFGATLLRRRAAGRRRGDPR